MDDPQVTDIAPDIADESSKDNLVKQREKIDALEAQVKAQDEQLKTQVFREAGFPIGESGPGMLMAGQWPSDRELTPETVKEFATANGLQTVTPETPQVPNAEAETRLAEVQSSSVSLTPETTDEELDRQIREAQEAGDYSKVIHLQTAQFGAS